MNSVKNMTEGNPAKLMILFALPLMLGNIFQQLYNVIDSMVIGQVLGVDGLAAFGATSWLTWLSLSLISGLTQGFGIMMSQRFGADDITGLRRAVGNSIVLSFIISVVLVFIMELLTMPLLNMESTPSDIIHMSALYLRIYYGGIPVTMAFNIFSSILRSLGDGRTPLIAMIIASLTNIVLDCFFIFVLGFGIAGAAAATIISQAVASIYCMRKVFGLEIIKLSRSDVAPDTALYAKLLYLGLPLAIQNTAISVGGIVVQRVINGFGVAFIAGATATNTLYAVLETSAISYGYSMTTYTGQNLGAGKMDRIKKGTATSMVIAMVTAFVLMIVMLIFGKVFLSLFISASAENAAEAMDTAYSYLRTISIFLFVLYYLYVIRSGIQGMGNTTLPLAAGIVELLVRIAFALTLPGIFGPTGIFYTEPLAWACAAIFLTPGYFYVFKKKNGSSITRSPKTNSGIVY